jgi:hypothetical protein
MMSATSAKLPGDRLSFNPDGVVITERYHVFGADDVYESLSASGIPSQGAKWPSYSKARAVKIESEDLGTGGDRTHLVTVTYERSFVKASEPQVGDEAWTYETVDVGAHIDDAITTFSYPEGTAKDNGNSIGVEPDGSVKGVDIADTNGMLTITKYYDYLDVLDEMPTWNGLLKSVNDNAFKVIFPAYSLLFSGYKVEPSFDNSKPTKVDFSFVFNRNLTSADLTNFKDAAGDTIDIVQGKNGHDYISTARVQVENPAATTYEWRVQGVYVHRVYPENDFSAFNFEATLVVNDDIAGS